MREILRSEGLTEDKIKSIINKVEKQYRIIPFAKREDIPSLDNVICWNGSFFQNIERRFKNEKKMFHISTPTLDNFEFRRSSDIPSSGYKIALRGSSISPKEQFAIARQAQAKYHFATYYKTPYMKEILNVIGREEHIVCVKKGSSCGPTISRYAQNVINIINETSLPPSDWAEQFRYYTNEKKITIDESAIQKNDKYELKDYKRNKFQPKSGIVGKVNRNKSKRKKSK